MDVSVIVCTYNRCRMLKGSLAALKGQQVAEGVRWEVIVVDNNCRDETASVVTHAAAGFPTSIRRVQEQKQGLSNARNRGISEARGKYLLFTDDDTRPANDWVQRIWEAFRSSSYDAVGGKVEILWPIARPSWFADELISSLAGVDYGAREIELSDDQPPLGANMAFTKRVFDLVGGFDPALGRIGTKLVGGEETDLFRRMCVANMKGIYEPRAVVKHVVEPERLRKHYFRKLYYYGGRSSGHRYETDSARKVAGIPVFAFRQLCQKVASVAVLGIAGKHDESFLKQLQAWWLVGFVAGCSRRKES